MMEIRGLIVEDEHRQGAIIRDHMDLEFEEIGLKANWSVELDAISARKTIRDHQSYDFAIVDYGLGEGQQSGIAVVEELRSRSALTYILVITGRGNENPNFRDEALKAGADDAVIRFALNTGRPGGMTFRDLAGRIRLHLARQRDFEGLKVVFPDNDLNLESTLHTIGSPNPPGDDSVAIGKDIVRSLAIECLAPDYRRDATVLTVGYLASGRSGAHVCRVDHEEGRSRSSHVLKIGLDRRALQFEVEANKRALRLLGTADLVGFSGQIRSHNESGYQAVTAPLAMEAVTLAEWLSTADVDEAATIAEILFGAQLIKLFAPGQREIRPLDEWLTGTPVLRLRLRDTLTLYREILAQEEAGATGTPGTATWADILIRFVDYGVLANGGKPDGTTTFIDAFGDLHSTNVLVYPGPHGRPVLVDASMYGRNHWAVDAARLVVDLVLAVRRAGPASLQWTDVGEVSGYLDRLCAPARAARPAVVTEAVDAFIGRVVDELPVYVHAEALQMTTEQWHWQWHAALAKELVRQGTRAGLPGPRAVAALTAAVHQLTFAADAYARISYTARDAGTSPACVANQADRKAETSAHPAIPTPRKGRRPRSTRPKP